MVDVVINKRLAAKLGNWGSRPPLVSIPPSQTCPSCKQPLPGQTGIVEMLMRQKDGRMKKVRVRIDQHGTTIIP